MTRFYLRRAYVVMAGLTLLAACTKKDAPPADTGQPGAPPPPAMPGALTKPLDQYTGEEFYALVQKLSYTGGHERERNCKNSPGCGSAATNKHVKVQVDAVATQDSIAPGDAPRFGVVYIRAVNRGDAEEARYSLKPGKNIEYYVVVTANGASAMRWQLVELDTTANARRVTATGSGVFSGCNHPWVRGASADFKTCQAARGAMRTDSTVRLGLMLQDGFSEPMWAACSMGCCILE